MLNIAQIPVADLLCIQRYHADGEFLTGSAAAVTGPRLESLPHAERRPFVTDNTKTHQHLICMQYLPRGDSICQGAVLKSPRASAVRKSDFGLW